MHELRYLLLPSKRLRQIFDQGTKLWEHLTGCPFPAFPFLVVEDRPQTPCRDFRRALVLDRIIPWKVSSEV